MLGKSHKLPFMLSESSSAAPFELIISDVWGPSPEASCSDFRYHVIFADDNTRFTWIYPFKTKDIVYNAYVSFSAFVATQFHTNFKTLRTDNDIEFLNRRFSTYLQNNGTVHQRTCPHTPEQNGLSEKKF